MSWLDRLIDATIKAPVKALLLPFRVLCIAVDGKHVMGEWEWKHGRWVRQCDVCAAEETRARR